jgi:predicted RNA binding protein YcfA (HicA-like mRNA interferase family)
MRNIKVPRDVSADQFTRALGRVGYRMVRQSGSHIKLEHELNKQWAVGFPQHSPLKVGMIENALKKVANQLGMDIDELILKLKL